LEIDLEEVVGRLYRLRYRAALVERRDVAIGNWKPSPQLCHHNVAHWVSVHADLTQIGGWLYFDLGNVGAAFFTAHSVVGTGWHPL
jgi:hypothetical protein